ncbi:MAG: DUF3696 domain-containing protein [Thaumarchaeota archaeon]|nr:DUF3696 domain-containing protein [Nitrososphaerota archaeon]
MVSALQKFEESIRSEGTRKPYQIHLKKFLEFSDKSTEDIVKLQEKGIEEPEINLHPKSQSKLAKIILDISLRKNQQIIFTTHSEHILFPLLTSVASKKENSLRKEDLAIYYFDTDEKYHTTYEKLEIDDYGRIKGGLRGFFEEDIDSLNEYLNALKGENQNKND